MELSKMNKHIKIVVAQAILLIFVFGIIYFIYPKAEIHVNGNVVNFNSINAKVVTISKNSDFSNPRYLDMTRIKNISLNLVSGIYYWKADNGIVEGLKKEFVIGSEVGLNANNSGNNTNLVNVGNVKINVTKTEEGVLVGHIILEPEESQDVKDNGQYTGVQND
jgi:hypothetical protein